MDKLIAGLLVGLMVFCLVLLLSFVFAIVTQWAWAGSVGQIFHLADLTFMQAFWLNVLGGMIAKGSSSGSSK